VFIASILLAIAIAIEVGATAVLPRAAGFTDPFWSAIVLVGYGVSIWLLTLIVKQLPVSMVYAIWSGLGTAAVAIVGVMWLHEPLTALKLVALGLIVGGVVLLNVGAPHVST
jgi:small multidrug resistance pump